jgi:hypothetical protein
MQMDQARSRQSTPLIPLRRKTNSTSAATARLSIGRRWCRCGAVSIRRRWCRRGSVPVRCRRCWCCAVRHYYGAVAVRRNNSFQAHCPYQNEHGKEHNRKFPGHFASGDERHPETLYPLLQGCQGNSCCGPVPYRYTLTRPVPSLGFRPLQMGPLIHYATRIEFRTCRVNSTVVLRVLGLKDSRPPGQVEQQDPTWTKEQSVSNLTRLPRSCPRECLTPLRQTS